MGKVVTSAGIQDFVSSGKHETIAPPDIPSAQEKIEAPEDKLATATAATEAADAKEALEGTELTADEMKLAGQRFNRVIGQKHRRMKEAQEAAAEAERFAETQYNEKRQLEREREELRTRLGELEKVKVEPQVQTPAKPTVEAFKDAQGQINWTAYTEAVATFTAEQAVAKDRAEREKQAAESAKQISEAAARERFQAAKTRYPDFEDTMGRAGDIQLPNAVLDYLRESDQGPDLTYFLIKHPEDASRLVKLSPTAALAAVGMLQAGLSVGKSSGATTPSNGSPQKAENKGGAPEPITPLGNGPGIVVKDPSKMDYKELRAYHRQRDMEKRRH